MIDEVKRLLADLKITKVAIVDDAYDELPEVSGITDGAWSRFFDDMTDANEASLKDAFGAEAYDANAPDDLRRDVRFITTTWQIRDQLGNLATDLFRDFENARSAKRRALEPLEALIRGSLGLSCETHGSRQDAATAPADIVFLDLFLGVTENEDTVERSIRKVQDVVHQRTKPPLVCLMSASSRLDSLASKVRDDAQLLGCQFRTIRKSELSDGLTTLERLYDLAVSYPDSQRLQKFVSEWESTLKNSTADFLRTIRTLDLPDYANLQALTLEAEGEPVGDYVIDLYDLFLHKMIERQPGLVKAAKDLNAIKWEEYPPAQFVPSADLMGMMDGALFYDQDRTRIEVEIAGDPSFVRFGDVFLSTAHPPLTLPSRPLEEGKLEELQGNSVQGPPSPARYVYAVLSQSCDLARAESDRILLLRGTANPLKWSQHNADFRTHKTPIMYVGDDKFIIEWDLTSPETWLLSELAKKLDTGDVTLARRFRLPYASQLLQAFVGNLSRVGTLAAVPTRHPASLSIFLKSAVGKAVLVHHCAAVSEEAVCLVGRKKNALKEWLLLSPKLTKDLRDIFVDAKSRNAPKDGRLFMDAVDDPALYRALTAGLEIRRDGDGTQRPFKAKPAYNFFKTSTKGATKEGADMANVDVVIIEINMD